MKALTKEDLLYILQSIFTISQQENNAFSMLEDGLYVEDYHDDLTAHGSDTDLHVDADIKSILNNLSLDEYGNLYYGTDPVNVAISAEDKNAIETMADGIYVKDITEETEAHMINEIVHVTPDDKTSWNNSLQEAKDYTDNEIDILPYFQMKAVTELPTEDILENTIYLLKDSSDCIDELIFILYVYYNSEWQKLGITKQTLESLAAKEELDLYLLKEDSHEHTNKAIIDNFTENENGELEYNGANISQIDISDELNNAIKTVNNKWYVKDYTEEIESLALAAAITKTNLLTEECAASGTYYLWDVIDNYSLIVVEYYYMPEDEEDGPGNAKTAILDVNTMNDLFERNIAYLLDLNYGAKSFNSKIRMNGSTMWVDYYHNVCIYKITGIKGGDISG